MIFRGHFRLTRSKSYSVFHPSLKNQTRLIMSGSMMNVIILVVMLIGFAVIFVLYSDIMSKLLTYKRKHQTIDVDDGVDLKSARDSIPMVNEAPKDLLLSYRFDLEYGTGVFDKWDSNSIALGSMCKNIKTGLQYSYHHPTEEISHRLIAIAENFILRYSKKLEKASAAATAATISDIPWGNNWYEFSVTSTCMLAYYLLLPQDLSMREDAARLILKLVKNPQLSLGYRRDEANAIYMVGPWYLARYTLGTLNDAAINSAEYRYVLRYINFQFQKNRTTNGLHRDYSFYAHSVLWAPAYLKHLCSDITEYFFRMNTRITETPCSFWAIARSYIQHPRIPLGLLGLNGRRDDLCMPANPPSPYGIRVMPFSRYLRYFTKDYAFSARAHVTWLGYYEADHSVDNTAQYWSQYRDILTEQSPSKLSYPNIGFVNPVEQKTALRLASRTDTTDIYYPKYARSIVLCHENFGLLYQKYMISEFGAFQVEEFIIVDSAKNTIRDIVTIDNSVEENQKDRKVLAYYDAKLLKNVVSVGARSTFETTFDLSTGQKTTQRLDAKSEQTPTFPLTLSDDTRVEIADNCAILTKNSKPRICAPFDLKEELVYLPVQYNGDLLVFRFCKDLNQYALTK